MKRRFANLACRLGSAALLRRGTRHRLRILMYHGVVERPVRPFCWHQLSVDRFFRQLSWVSARFRVLPLREALERLEGNTLPPNSCAITFDDGYRNCLSVAEPVLRALRMPATVFLPTGAVTRGELLWPDRVFLALARTRIPAVDAAELGLGWLSLEGDGHRAKAFDLVVEALKRVSPGRKDAFVERLIAETGVDPAQHAGDFRLLDWEDVARLRDGGLVDVAPHSATHEILSRCDDDELRSQVLQSYAALASFTGRQPRIFAYPNGREEDFDMRTRALLAEVGIRWALTAEPGLNGNESDPLALRRICVGADLEMAFFKLLISGWASSPRSQSPATFR